MKFKLHDIRESKVWQQACAEGDANRLKQTVLKLVEKRKTLDEISDLLDIPTDELRRTADEPAEREAKRERK